MGCDTGPWRGPVPEKEKSHNFGQNAAAQNDLKRSKNGQNCTHTLRTRYAHACTRIKRNVPTPKGLVPPRRGGKGAGKPKAERATTKKET